jgi:hypothetical protein
MKDKSVEEYHLVLERDEIVMEMQLFSDLHKEISKAGFRSSPLRKHREYISMRLEAMQEYYKTPEEC